MGKIEKDKYFEILASLGVPPQLNKDFLYDVFNYAIEGSSNIKKDSPVFSKFGINPVQITLYLCHEHLFYLLTHPDKKEEDVVKDEAYMHFLSSVALDKYFTNEHMAFDMNSLTSRFSPTLSTLNLYLNFILGVLNKYKKGDPDQTLLIDIMVKGFQMAKCVSSLLEQGYETEAFSTWRTLHENESILTVLLKYGKDVAEAYLKHMRYAMAFRGAYGKQETDAIFVEIKQNMAKWGLKSKDMKRYIEYGWLYSVPNYEKIPEFKLNFRDGVQKAAGLSSYSKVYEMSSEIAHSSPLLIYSRKNYFFSLSLINLYESFFRLEKVFSTIYMASIDEANRNNYQGLRKLYNWQLNSCYEMEKTRFSKIRENK